MADKASLPLGLTIVLWVVVACVVGMILFHPNGYLSDRHVTKEAEMVQDSQSQQRGK